MYIENLQSPHPRTLRPGAQARPFLEIAELDRIRDDLSDATNYDIAADQATSEIIGKGRRALRFPANDMRPKLGGETAFDTLLDEQITTCLGYTAVLSECLDALEVPHYIGFANTHWMVLRPSADGSKLHMADMLSPIFNQDISTMISKGDPQSIAFEAAKKKRSAVMLTTLGFQSCSQQAMDELDQQYPWLTVAKHTNADNHQYTDDKAKYTSDHTCVLSVYESSTGSDVMHEYASFRSAMLKSNLGDASERLHNMRGLYPEVDARAPHHEIRKLIKGLCATGEFELATRAADDYASSFSVSADPRLKELEGDMYRYIGKVSRDPQSARLSYQAYEAAASSSKSGCSSKVLGKVAASSSLVSELDA